MKCVARLRGTVQSLIANIVSLSSEKEILQKNQNDVDFMSDGAKAQEKLLAARNSKLAQQWDDVQRHLATIRRSMPEYRSKWSADIESGFKEFCRRLLKSAHENVQSSQ